MLTSFPPVIFLVTDFAHHSQYSGYQQLAMRWPGNQKALLLPQPPGPTRSAAARRLGLFLYNCQLWVRKRQAVRLLRQTRFPFLYALYGETDLPMPGLPAGSKLVTTLHQPSCHLNRSAQRVKQLKQQLEHVNLCITVSRDLAHYINTITPAMPACFVPHGVDTDFFHPTGLARHRSVLISCGWYRDLGLAREVAQALYKLDPAVSVRAFGSTAAQLAGISGNLTVLGRLTDEQLRQEYNANAALFLPLSQATANNSLLEAVACGTPVVAPQIDGVVDYLDIGETLYALGSSAAEIAGQIIAITNGEQGQDTLSWRTLGLKYSWSQVIEQVRHRITNL